MIAVGAGGAGVLLFCALVPTDALAVENPALLVGLETAAGLGALVAWWVTVLRAERTSGWGDAALALAIGVITAGSLLASVLTRVFDISPSEIPTWAPVPGRILAGFLLIAAGLIGRAAIPSPPRRFTLVAATLSVVLVMTGGGVALGAVHAGSEVPLLLQLATAALFVIAAIALAGRGRRTGDPVLPWFAAFALALATVRLAGVLESFPAGSWIAADDLVRLGAVGLLLMAAWAEVGEAGRRSLQSAIHVERSRLAREIHDGLAQELAFIVSQSRRLAKRSPQGGGLDLLVSASETALMDARRTIFSLKAPRPRALSTAVAQRAFIIAERAGLALDVEVLDEASVAPEVEHAILRIIEEAVTNIARHAEATSVSIRVSTEKEHVVVRIVDDGRGFDPRLRRRRSAFGLVSMTERAELLGGRLRLDSEPGRGTVIEVAF